MCTYFTPLILIHSERPFHVHEPVVVVGLCGTDMGCDGLEFMKPADQQIVDLLLYSADDPRQ